MLARLLHRGSAPTGAGRNRAQAPLQPAPQQNPPDINPREAPVPERGLESFAA